MRIAIVVIAAENGCIGRNNQLPWHLPDDLKRFKQVTMGKPILMGRKTHESIGKALPGRTNIVVSRQPGFEAAGCVVVPSIEAGIAAAGSAAELCVIGGADIFAQVLRRTDILYFTRVHASVDGDVFFPSPNFAQWREISREEHAIDARHAYPFTFLTLERL